ncbi:hypothetical protein BTR23_07485 [Alkalihalophilus pseudofirmus]|nr:hypothetical protein BTR23_07485 [Alkalihalophilus pseudofirmus]
MAEKLLPTDSLREGYPKINDALDEVNYFQKQIDEIVVEGDSSVEAAQARLDAEGNSYSTLKERLDTEHTGLSEHLAQIAIQTTSFGTTGDGTEQSAKIQSAIDSLLLTGGTVLIPSGLYLIENTLLLPDNVYLRGVGDKTVLKLTAGESRPIISNADPENGNTNIRIENIMLDGNRTQQTHDGNNPYPWAGVILYRNVKRSTIRDVKVTSSFRYSINIASTLFPDPNFEKASEDILITGVDCSDFGDDGVTVHQSRRVIVTDSFFHGAVSVEDGSPSGNSNGVEADDGCGDIIIANCIAYDCMNGYQIKGHPERTAARRVVLSNCLALDNWNEGIAIRQLGAQLDQSTDVILSNCFVENSGSHGVWVHDYKNVHIDNVGVKNSGGHGLFLEQVEKAFISNISIEKSVGTGIFGTKVNYVNFSNIDIDDADFGLRFDESSYNMFNSIRTNKTKNHGIHMRSNCHKNKFSMIDINAAGISYEFPSDGIRLSSGSVGNNFDQVEVRRLDGFATNGFHIAHADCANNFISNLIASSSFASKINDLGTGTIIFTENENASQRSSNADTGIVSNRHFRQINASERSRASASWSQVNASTDVIASGERSVISASSVSAEARELRSMVFASQRVINDVPSSVAGGAGGTGDASTANRKWHVYSTTGNIEHSGTMSSGHSFTDFAELFPNSTGVEQGNGLLQTLDGHGVRPAQEGERVIGVTSATAGIILGDTPFSWQGRWLKDEFGAYIYEDVEDEETGEMVSVPKENPDYDPEKEQLTRKERPDEWSVVGLVGQVYVRVTEECKVTDYIKAYSDGIGTVSDAQTNIQVMKITTPYDSAKGYSVAFCIIK